MPEEQDIIYERKRGTQYIIQNSTEKETKFGKKVTQGVMAPFMPQSDRNQMGVFNVTKYVGDWVQYEINAGNIEIGDDKTIEKEKKKLTDAIVHWIENHQDYNQGIIWKKMTKEQRLEAMRESIRRQQEELAAMEGRIEEMPEEEMEKITEPDKAKSDGMVTGGGVIESAGVSNARNRPGRPKRN